MRPVRLTMTAFGPYRDAETIDFAKLEDHRLFVISGITGAGKTTIFDAICYALYGAASGGDRGAEARMLRSDFASDELYTSVDFTFRVGARVYRVFRQMGHRKGGNKSETGARAELYELTDGREVPCAEFKLKEVNAKLEQIIGLTKDQFSQIVMLPQGEFQKLLTSDTENKEEILRRIFRTGLFQKLEDRFQQMSRELRDRHKEAASRLSVYLAQAGEALPVREGSALARTLRQPAYNAAQIASGLAEEVAHYAQSAAAAQAQREELDGRIRLREEELRAAAALNGRFAERDAKLARRREMERQLPAVAERERRLQDAERAARIEPFEEMAARAAEEAASKRAQLAQKRQETEKAGQELAEAEAVFVREEAREPERKAAERELARLSELEPIVRTLEKDRQEVGRLAAERDACAAQLEAAEAAIASLRERQQAAAEQLRGLERETAELPDMQLRRERLAHKFRLLQELLAAERQLGEFARLAAEREQALRRLAAEYERIEAQWLEGQAGMLAAHLHDGEPCPVCGSTAHPAKAAAGDAVPSREQVQQAMERLRAAERELTEAQAQAAAARAGRSNRSQEMREYGIRPEGLAEQKDQVEQEGKRLKAAIEELRLKAARQAELRDEAERTGREWEAQLKRKDELNRRLQELSAGLGAKESAYRKDLERVPADLRDPAELAARIREQKERADRLASAWRSAQERLHLLQARHAAEKAREEELQRQAEEAEANMRQAQERFARELEAAGFASGQAFREAKLPETQRRAMQEEIRAFREAMAALDRQLAELEQELAGKQPAALDELEAAVGALKRELEQAIATEHAAERYRQEAQRLQAAVEQADAGVRELEAELGRVTDIHQMLKGDNALKISFERYILIEYMEQILQAANARLQRLSGGQFLLKLREGQEARGRQSGLGLDVYDAYTGQNRDVKTLSGGEKFNASLSLALGMTDVIQASQGGVSIEMMFIDEGFGSLDEESLHKAIATLIDLQRAGRMIGVISHVCELKQAFPAALEVTKTKEGYSRTRIVVK